MTSFPYTPSVKSISDAFTAFRKSLPASIDSDTLKKLQIAPNNESALISILSFLSVIDSEGKTISVNSDFFYGSDDNFKDGISKLTENAYNDIFSLFGPDSWNEPQEKLVGFFSTGRQDISNNWG